MSLIKLGLQLLHLTITKEHLKLDLGNGFLVSALENLNINRPIKEDEIKDIIISEMDKIFNIM